MKEYVQTMKLLSAAGIAVYPIDTFLETDNPAYSSPQSRYPRPLSRYPGERNSLRIVQNFMDISQRTGGDYCLLRKDPDLCFRKAVDYGSQYYLLSYYTRSPAIARWRKIQVKVRGTDLQVRTRSGYFSAGANGDPEKRRKNDIAQAVTTPVEYRGLPISVRWTTSGEQPASQAAGNAAPAAGPQLSQRRPKQPFVLEIGLDAVTLDAADNNHIQLEVVAVALDRSGQVLADLTRQFDLRPKAPELERLRSVGLVYSDAVEVPPHTSKVRFSVRDDLSERLGTVSVPIASQP